MSQDTEDVSEAQEQEKKKKGTAFCPPTDSTLIDPPVRPSYLSPLCYFFPGRNEAALVFLIRLLKKRALSVSQQPPLHI